MFRPRSPAPPGVAVAVGVACATTLHYDGSVPVNVNRFLGIFVLGQVALLGLMTIALAWGKGSMLAPLLRACAQSRWVTRQRADFADGAGAAAARFEQHADVERLTLFVLAQRVAVAGNVAAMAVLLALVAFTDLAFCWSSTLFDSATVMRNLTQAVAAPWAWCLPDAAPGLPGPAAAAAALARLGWKTCTFLCPTEPAPKHVRCEHTIAVDRDAAPWHDGP